MRAGEKIRPLFWNPHSDGLQGREASLINQFMAGGPVKITAVGNRSIVWAIGAGGSNEKGVIGEGGGGMGWPDESTPRFRALKSARRLESVIINRSSGEIFTKGG